MVQRNLSFASQPNNMSRVQTYICQWWFGRVGETSRNFLFQRLHFRRSWTERHVLISVCLSEVKQKQGSHDVDGESALVYWKSDDWRATLWRLVNVNLFNKSWWFGRRLVSACRQLSNCFLPTNLLIGSRAWQRFLKNQGNEERGREYAVAHPDSPIPFLQIICDNNKVTTDLDRNLPVCSSIMAWTTEHLDWLVKTLVISRALFVNKMNGKPESLAAVFHIFLLNIAICSSNRLPCK